MIVRRRIDQVPEDLARRPLPRRWPLGRAVMVHRQQPGLRLVHVGEELYRAFGPRFETGGDLGHGCEVVIVMFRNEVAEIDHRHRLVEPWMARTPRKILWRHLREPRENRHSRSAKCGDQIGGDAIVVLRLVRQPVRRVCGVKHRRAAIEIVEPLIPDRLEVEEMAGMLLNRPAALRPVHTNVAGTRSRMASARFGVRASAPAAPGPRPPARRRRSCDRTSVSPTEMVVRS